MENVKKIPFYVDSETWRNSFPFIFRALPPGFWDLEECESSHIALFLYVDPGTWKTFELSCSYIGSGT